MSQSRMAMCLFVGFLLVAFHLGCASSPTSESTGEYFDDTVITTKIKALLAKDDVLKPFQIGVETYKGVVQLSGFVNTEQTREKADYITRTVKGVKSVKNNLIVK